MKFILLITIVFLQSIVYAQLKLYENLYLEDSCSKIINESYGFVKVSNRMGWCEIPGTRRHNTFVKTLLWFRNGPNWQKRYQKKLAIGCDSIIQEQEKLVVLYTTFGAWSPIIDSCEQELNKKYGFISLGAGCCSFGRTMKNNTKSEQKLIERNGIHWKMQYQKELKESCCQLSSLKKQKMYGDTLILKLELITNMNSVAKPPYCGVFMHSIQLEYTVLEVKNGVCKDSIISINHYCPSQKFSRGYFKTNKAYTYKLAMKMDYKRDEHGLVNDFTLYKQGFYEIIK